MRSFLLLLLIRKCAAFGYLTDDNESVFVDLLGNATYPEGILALPNGDLLVGGFGDGSLQRLEDGGSSPATYFSAPGENGMVITVGFALDEDTGYLWVANFNFNVSDSGVPGSQLKLFDLNGTLLATLPSFEEYEMGVFLNEVAIDHTGRVYVSDTFNPKVWTATLETGLQVLLEDELLVNPDRPFGQNGLAVSPDGHYLLVSVMDRLDAGGGRLVRIDLTTLLATNITLTGAVDAFAGSDGMFFYDEFLFMVNVFSEVGAIFTAEFDANFTTADLVIRDAFQAVYNRPTASDIRYDRLWTVNSQLNHIIDDEDGELGTAPDLPFQVVHVSLDTLLA